MFILITGNTLGIPIHVFGPETHMTAIVSMALGKREIPHTPRPMNTTANFLLPTGGVSDHQTRHCLTWSSRSKKFYYMFLKNNVLAVM